MENNTKKVVSEEEVYQTEALDMASSQTVVGYVSRRKKREDVIKVKVLERRQTLNLSVRFRDLLSPLLFPIRRGSQEFDSGNEEEFVGYKGWVTLA